MEIQERPIIFNQEMVKAILEGRKSQTRRVIKPQPFDILGDEDEYIHCVGNDYKKYNIKIPYRIGQKLWVREIFGIDWENKAFYKEAYNRRRVEAGYLPRFKKHPCWKSSIFMPKKYARIWLKVIDIRVEKIQDISENDCIKEGVKMCYWYRNLKGEDVTFNSKYKMGFANLWDNINAKHGYGWEENPFCWVIEFKRINK